MRLIFLTMGIVLGVSGITGCSDPDIVPASHISATPPPAASDADESVVKRFPNRTALFGDLHVHTSWSSDAYTGDNRLGPNSAYRFAKGEKVELPNGHEAQLPSPLDFVALTDHAEGFGSHLACTTPGSAEFDAPQCRALRSGAIDQETLLESAFEIAGTRPMPRNTDTCGSPEQCQANERTTWQRIQEVANAHNDPGSFTTLIGYEFSALLEQFGMLHRNVIFRGSDVTPHAISALDVDSQRDFFNQLDAACKAPCEVLTIPHNTNYSWGLTFSRNDLDGADYTSDDLDRRARIERLFEVTQAKGTSECQISVGAADEDCNFGILFPACENNDDLRCARASSMLRNVLLDGLELGEEDDLNPYKLGVIGSTDTHQSDPGNTSPDEIPPQFAPAASLSLAANRLLETDHIVAGPVRQLTAGGLAGVWSEANTREDIFAALQRREAFATSGSRMRIRLFAGNLPEDLLDREDAIATAYETGVPMGSSLNDTTEPRFWVWASQDPDGSSLDRIQIVKGWIEDGKQRSSVRDIACSGNREPGENGQCPPTTAAVNLETCEQTGNEGARTLQSLFVDPDHIEGQAAFYYARVLENPTCHWTRRLTNATGADQPIDVPATVHERGWSSPIWLNSP